MGTSRARNYNSKFRQRCAGDAERRRPILVACARTLPRSLCSRENFGGKFTEHLPEIASEMAQIAETASESDLRDGSSRISFQEHLPCTSQAHGFCKSHRRVSAVFFGSRVEAADAGVCMRCQLLNGNSASPICFDVFFRQPDYERRCFRSGPLQNLGEVVPVTERNATMSACSSSRSIGLGNCAAVEFS